MAPDVDKLETASIPAVRSPIQFSIKNSIASIRGLFLARTAVRRRTTVMKASTRFGVRLGDARNFPWPCQTGAMGSINGSKLTYVVDIVLMASKCGSSAASSISLHTVSTIEK